MRKTTAILAAAACMTGSALAAPSNNISKRYLRDPAQTVTGNELAYEVPAPVSSGGKAWSDAHARAKDLVGQMSVEEKVGIVTGQPGVCAGQTKAVERLGIPSLCLQDGPAGVRPADGHTQFPAGVTTAATWDRELIYNRSRTMGQEFYDLGVNVALTPVTGGPIGANPVMGRNFEGWWADPYGTGIASYLSVKGIQDAGVVATAKHFLGYEQETSRNIYLVPNPDSPASLSNQLPVSSNIDDRTTHEVYMWGFAEAVRAGVGSVMCAYNRVNGTHACHNSVIQNGHLKGELNFQGNIMSDWGGTWDSQAAALGGLDLEMPGLNFGGALGTFYDTSLEALVNNGTVSQERLEDMAVRVLTPYFALGQAETALPSVNVIPWNFPTANLTAANPYRLVQKPSTRELIKQIAEDGTVLLKNDGALPLKTPARISIIGSKAGPGMRGDRNCGATGRLCEGPSLGGGSGWAQALNYIDPLMSIRQRALEDSSAVDWVLNDTDLTAAQYSAVQADVALVFVSAWATEEADRDPSLTYTYRSAVGRNGVYDGEALIQAVAASNPNTIVVAYMPGATILDAWIDHPNITAVVSPLQPGEQAGPALVSVLYGDVSPSGKLPFTIAKNIGDYPPDTLTNTTDINPQNDFTEGVNFDYRWFDVNNITPRYEFGYGLSYSNFTYNNLGKDATFHADIQAIQTTNEKFKGQNQGESLYDTLLTVSVDVKNVGDVVACEVAQLYVQYPDGVDQPPKQLRGFDKAKRLGHGETKTLSFPIRRKDVAMWNVVEQIWEVPQGQFTFHVGSSSRQLPLTTTHSF